MNILMAFGFVTSHFVFQRSSAFLVLPVCPQTPSKARLLNIQHRTCLCFQLHLFLLEERTMQDISVLSRVTNFSQLKLAGNVCGIELLTERSPALATCMVGLKSGTEPPNRFLASGFYPLHIRCESSSQSFYYSFLLVEYCTVGLTVYSLSHLKKCPGLFRMAMFIYLVPLLLRKK